MKEDLKLDFMDMKTLVINKLNEEIVLVYIRREDGKHALQISINGEVVRRSIKPVLIEYAEYNGIELGENKTTTYQIFDEIYKLKYNTEI